MIKNIFPSTTHRVPANTNSIINENIRRKTISNLENTIVVSKN
ncbi:MAG: hypothetical protein AB9836_07260 [Aminipila sp.]